MRCTSCLAEYDNVREGEVDEPRPRGEVSWALLGLLSWPASPSSSSARLPRLCRRRPRSYTSLYPSGSCGRPPTGENGEKVTLVGDGKGKMVDDKGGDDGRWGGGVPALGVPGSEEAGDRIGEEF
jgi:hypothetical protein